MPHLSKWPRRRRGWWPFSAAGRKEKKALATVLAGLKELNLGTPEK